MTDAEKINVEDIRKGDLIRFEYEASEQSGMLTSVEFIAPQDEFEYSYQAGQHYRLVKPRKPLPTDHGTIINFPKLVPLIKDGSSWYFTAPTPQKAMGAMSEEQVWERAVRSGGRDVTFEVLHTPAN